MKVGGMKKPDGGSQKSYAIFSIDNRLDHVGSRGRWALDWSSSSEGNDPRPLLTSLQVFTHTGISPPSPVLSSCRSRNQNKAPRNVDSQRSSSTVASRKRRNPVPLNFTVGQSLAFSDCEHENYLGRRNICVAPANSPLTSPAGALEDLQSK